MKDLFVSYKQAAKLKELGFDEPCFGIWMERGNKHDVIYVAKQEDAWMAEQNDGILAPLKQQVLRWFREKYNIIGLIEGGFDITNIFTYCIWEGFKDKIYDDYYGTYEEAEDVLINILIDKVKNK